MVTTSNKDGHGGGKRHSSVKDNPKMSDKQHIKKRTDQTSVFRRKQFERMRREERVSHVLKVLLLIIAVVLAIICAVVYKL